MDEQTYLLGEEEKIESEEHDSVLIGYLEEALRTYPIKPQRECAIRDLIVGPSHSGEGYDVTLIGEGLYSDLIYNPEKGFRRPLNEVNYLDRSRDWTEYTINVPLMEEAKDIAELIMGGNDAISWNPSKFDSVGARKRIEVLCALKDWDEE